MAGQILACNTIFSLILMKCQYEEESTCIENTVKPIGGILLVVCLVVLTKLNAENCGINSVSLLKYFKSKYQNELSQAEGIFIVEEIFPDQGMQIYLGGCLITAIGAFLQLILVMSVDIDITLRQLTEIILTQTFIPVYWIYKSEKLRVIMRKYFCFARA